MQQPKSNEFNVGEFKIWNTDDGYMVLKKESGEWVRLKEMAMINLILFFEQMWKDNFNGNS